MPVLKKMRVILFCVLLLVANTSARPRDSEELSTADRAEIIQKAMEIRLEREGPEKFSEYLIISTENMSTEPLPRIPGFEFKLMKASETKDNRGKQNVFVTS
jgi:hypothetical protein